MFCKMHIRVCDTVAYKNQRDLKTILREINLPLTRRYWIIYDLIYKMRALNFITGVSKPPRNILIANTIDFHTHIHTCLAAVSRDNKAAARDCLHSRFMTYYTYYKRVRTRGANSRAIDARLFPWLDSRILLRWGELYTIAASFANI